MKRGYNFLNLYSHHFKSGYISFSLLVTRCGSGPLSLTLKQKYFPSIELSLIQLWQRAVNMTLMAAHPRPAVANDFAKHLEYRSRKLVSVLSLGRVALFLCRLDSQGWNY